MGPGGGGGTFNRPITSQEAVLREIRQAIMSRQLKPGERVRQWDLAKRLNVSSVPIREALKTLEAEGQVTYEPHRGYTVVRLSIEDVEEIYLMRRVLETEGTTQAVPKVDVDLVQHLERLVGQMDEFANAGDVLDYTEANRRFHLLLFERAELPRLYRLIEILWQNTEAYRGLIFDSIWYEHAQEDHRELLDACREKDVFRALAVQDRHRSKALSKITSLLKEIETES
ncbi:MAG: GntR family transcriptional regulator [Rubrobacteraceae bacterium]